MAKRFEDAKRFTEKFKDKILPCRSCGSKNVRVVSERSIFDSKNVWYIGCCDCPDCGPESTSVRKAIKFWNGDVFRNQAKRRCLR